MGAKTIKRLDMKLLQNFKKRRKLKKLTPKYYKFFKQNDLIDYALDRLNRGYTDHQAVILKDYPVMADVSLAYFLARNFDIRYNEFNSIRTSNVKQMSQSIMELQSLKYGPNLKVWTYKQVTEKCKEWFSSL